MYSGDSYLGETDINGRFEVATGQTVQVTRLVPGSGCAVPEGNGVSYTSDGAPTATVTLPTFNTDQVDPALSNRERVVIGVINQRRAEAGVPTRVQASATLNRAMDALFGAAAKNGTAFDDQCSMMTSQARIFDAGWPSGEVQTYFGFGADDATEPGHQMATNHPEFALNPEYTSIGIAFIGGDYAITFAKGCAPEAAARCELIAGEFGDSNLSTGGDDTDDDTAVKPRNPALRILSTRVKGHGRTKTVTVKVRVADGAQGKLYLTPKGKGAHGKVCAQISSTKSVKTLKLKLRKGSYRLEVAFNGTGGWKDASKTKRLRVK